MFRFLIEAAWRLDQWLKDKVGRPYTILLTAGLVAGMVANIRAAILELRGGGNLAAIALTIALYAILLVNQLAQLHEYRQAVRTGREARKSSKGS